MKIDAFNSYCAIVCEEVDDEVNSILMVDDDEGIMAATLKVSDGREPFRQAAVSLFGKSRNCAAMATRVQWSPTEEGESSLAWALTTVTADGPAHLFVRRSAEDDDWWVLEPGQMPWFALSTAGALRAALKGDVDSFTLKETPPNDRRLLNRPGEGDPPPEDEEGRI